MRCGNITYQGEKIWIPGCMGSAVYGKHRCTCYKPVTKASKEQTIENIEDECRQLRYINDQLNKKCKKLENENMQLIRRGLPLRLRRLLDGDKVYLKTFLSRLIDEWKTESGTERRNGPTIELKNSATKK